MQTKNSWLLSVTVLLASMAAPPHVGAATPGDLLAELNRALRNQPAAFPWSADLNPSFSAWRVGGSENIPVIAAAVALIRAPIGTMPNGTPYNIYNWWHSLLNCQNGFSCNVADPGSLVYFKGSEMMANTYDWTVTISVAVVNWWAHANLNNPNVTVRNHAIALTNEARLYLRKTWVVYALAAGSSYARQFRDQISEAVDSSCSGLTQFVHRCQINTGCTPYFDGPFLALASPRTNRSYYCTDNRGVLLAQAIAWPLTKNGQEDQRQADLRAYIETNWPGNTPGENVYALNSNDRLLVRNHINDITQIPAFLGVLNNGNTRFRVRMHFLGWPGVRVSMIEESRNNNTKGPLYAAKYERSTREAHMLYPWRPTASNGYQRGYGRLLPAETSPVQVEVSNTADDETPPANHGGEIVLTSDLPSPSPLYHVVVGPDSPASQM